MQLKILSFNWHEPYLCLLSDLKHSFYIVEPEISNGVHRLWDANMRPIPSNFKILSESEALKHLDNGEFDMVIAHNIKDLVLLKNYNLPKILVFHNKLSTEINLGNNKINRDEYLLKINPLLKGVKKIFISKGKQYDWGMEGTIIIQGIDVDKYGGYTGEIKSVLRVGNMLKERDIMMGYSNGEAILTNLPSSTLGINPQIYESRLSKSFEDLKSHYQSHRVYLNTTREPYEDGYNLSLLEAMAVGMPVVSTLNKTSPIKNEVNGFISDDLEYLTKCAQILLEDKKLAKKLGEEGRKTVQENLNF